MKKLLFVTLVGLFTAIGVNAQEKEKVKVDEKDVPQAVKTAFESQYASASNAEWKMKDGKYKVKFEQDGTKHMAELTSSGELVSKSTKIEKEELPTLVSDAVKATDANKEIDEVYRVEKNGKTHYMVKLEGNSDKKLVYDAQGKLVKEK